MAVKFEIYLSDEDTERLFAVKEDKGKAELTGNDYARELLERELHRLHPRQPVQHTRLLFTYHQNLFILLIQILLL